MKSPKNIFTYLFINSLVVYSMLILAITLSIISFTTFKSALKESRSHLYSISTNGEIIPLQHIQDNANIEIEIKHHIEMFVENFYSLDQFNVVSKTEKARWLADVRKWYDLRLSKNFYNEIRDFHIRYSASIDNLKIAKTGDDTYSFVMVVAIIRSDNNLTTNLYTEGNIVLTARNYPHNPHGLFIENYTETRKEVVSYE